MSARHFSGRQSAAVQPGATGYDGVLVSLDGVQKEPKSLLQTGETISHARFSPDGRWIVYTASAAGSGRGGIYTGGGTYVQPYPGRDYASR